MMNSSSGMEDPLTTTAEDNDAASQSSQRSGRSLLERIQMQRQREAAAAAMQTTTPQQIQVPNYGNPAMMQGIGNTNNGSVPSQIDENNMNFFSNAWGSFSQSMESGMAAATSQQQQQQDDGMEDALLPPSALIDTDENYSMSNYALTFVRDVYGLFLRMHVVLRVIVFVGLLYVAIKLL
jgi:hypothetical protein